MDSFCDRPIDSRFQFKFISHFEPHYCKSGKVRLRCFPSCNLVGHTLKGFCGGEVIGEALVRRDFNMDSVLILGQVCPYDESHYEDSKFRTGEEYNETELRRRCLDAHDGLCLGQIYPSNNNSKTVIDSGFVLYNVVFTKKPWIVIPAAEKRKQSTCSYTFLVTVLDSRPNRYTTSDITSSRIRLSKASCIRCYSSREFSLQSHVQVARDILKKHVAQESQQALLSARDEDESTEIARKLSTRRSLVSQKIMERTAALPICTNSTIATSNNEINAKDRRIHCHQFSILSIQENESQHSMNKNERKRNRYSEELQSDNYFTKNQARDNMFSYQQTDPLFLNETKRHYPYYYDSKGIEEENNNEREEYNIFHMPKRRHFITSWESLCDDTLDSYEKYIPDDTEDDSFLSGSALTTTEDATDEIEDAHADNSSSHMHSFHLNPFDGDEGDEEDKHVLDHQLLLPRKHRSLQDSFLPVATDTHFPRRISPHQPSYQRLGTGSMPNASSTKARSYSDVCIGEAFDHISQDKEWRSTSFSFSPTSFIPLFSLDDEDDENQRDGIRIS